MYAAMIPILLSNWVNKEEVHEMKQKFDFELIRALMYKYSAKV